MQTTLLVVHLIIALLLIGAILMQRSEGGALGIGGSGGGGGGNLFSARGVGNGLTRTTAILAVCFFLTSITLTILATRQNAPKSVFEAAPAANGETQAPASGADLLPKLGQEAPVVPAAPVAPQVPTSN